MIRLDHVSKRFGDLPSVDDVSLSIPTGEIYGIVGQSGAGKSTLARMVNLIERPDSGSVVVDGTDLTALNTTDLRVARRKFGMVFQRFNLLGSRSVRGNVELALELDGSSRTTRRARAQEMLDLVGLGHRGDASVHELSGGQQQRVGIARALAARPTVLLSDEATSALDPETTASILDLYRRVNRELGLTVLLITHEMEVVKRICDAAALMEHGRVIDAALGFVVNLGRSPRERPRHRKRPAGGRHHHARIATDGATVPPRPDPRERSRRRGRHRHHLRGRKRRSPRRRPARARPRRRRVDTRRPRRADRRNAGRTHASRDSGGRRGRRHR